MLKKLKAATTPFGWLIVKSLILILPAVLVLTITNTIMKNNNILFLLCSFFWTLLLLSIVLIFDNIVEKADNIKDLNALLHKIKKKGYVCSVEPNSDGFEIFSRGNTTFLFACDDKRYVAGECGCFEADTSDEQDLYDTLTETDEIYYEVLSALYSKITNSKKNYVKKIQDNTVLLYVNNEYIIQKNSLAFEIWEGDAEDILEDNKDMNSVFERYLNERIGNKNIS